MGVAMSRGISTVLDVGIAIVLIGASVGVLAGVPVPTEEQGMAAHRGGGVAVAGSTMSVEYDREDGQTVVVTRTVAGHVRDAAIARDAGVGDAYTTAVESAVADRIGETGTRAQLVGACESVAEEPDREAADGDPFAVGPAPPLDRPVDATVYRWNGSDSEATADCEPVVVVRSWSS